MQRKQRTQQQTEAYQASPPRIRIRPGQASLAKTDQGETAPDRSEPDGTEGHPPATAGHPRGNEGVYVISVAARLLEMHPQTLRKYERLGLVQPARTIGMLRLYSEQDLYQLRLIRHMEESLGLNLAGVEWALSLVSQLLEMHRRLAELVEAERLHRVLQQEMERLFTAMNLPLSDPPPDRGQTPEAQTDE